MCAGPDPVGEQGAGLVAVDDPAPLARGMAVAGVDLGRGAALAYAELHDPVRGGRPSLLRPSPFEFLLLGCGDGRADVPIQMVSCCSGVRSRGRSGGKSYMCSTLRRGAEWMRRTA